MTLTLKDSAVFQRIRTQINSNLPNQKQVAVTLMAIESTIEEQNQPLSDLAYFGSLMTVISQQKDTAVEDAQQQEILASAIYILAIVMPHVPASVLRKQFDNLIAILIDLFSKHMQNASIMKSTISSAESFMKAQDNSTWLSKPLSRQLFNCLLPLCLDNRPKVAKRAQEAIKSLLAHCPPPSLSHPATDWFLDAMNDAIRAYNSLQRENSALLMHVLQTVQVVISSILNEKIKPQTRKRLENLSLVLVQLPRQLIKSSNSIVIEMVFSTLSKILGISSQQESSETHHLSSSMVVSILKSIMDMRPDEKDNLLVPLWTKLASDCVISLFSINMFDQPEGWPLQSIQALAHVFTPCMTLFFTSKNTKVIKAVAKTLSSTLHKCLTKRYLDNMTSTDFEELDALLSLLQKSLTNIRIRQSWGGVLTVVSALFESIGYLNRKSMIALLDDVMVFRDDEAYATVFPFKEEMDDTIISAIASMGIQNFLESVPLNIEQGSPKRPYLLASIPEALKKSNELLENKSSQGAHSMSYYIYTLIPLAGRLFEKSADCYGKSKIIEGKVYETLATQIWDLFVPMCHNFTFDLSHTYKLLAPILGKLLQSGDGRWAQVVSSMNDDMDGKSEEQLHLPDLRPIICHGLAVLVEKVTCEENSSIINEDSNSELYKIHNLLTTYSSRFLNALCNNYTNVDPKWAFVDSQKEKNQAVQTIHDKENQSTQQAIEQFLKIANGESVQSYFLHLFKNVLQLQASEDQDLTVSLRIYAIMDLMLLMLPRLPCIQQPTEFLITDASSPVALMYRMLIGQIKSGDSTLQKKTYKALLQLIHILGNVYVQGIQVHVSFVEMLKDLVENLMHPETLSCIASGAKRARVSLFGEIIQVIPLVPMMMENSAESSLISLLEELIPLALPEIMLSTKESSEKARLSAFKVFEIVHNKMREAGVLYHKESIGDIAALDQEMTLDDANQDPDDKVNLSYRNFLTMVIAGLAGSTSGMQSASVSCLAKTLFDDHAYLSVSLSQQIVETVLYFCDSPSREVLKAVLGFVKVAVIALDQEDLEDLLEPMIQKLFQLAKKNSHFRVKVRFIIEKLMRRFSDEVIEGFVPEADKRLIANIQKRRERAKKPKDGSSFDEVMNGSDDEHDEDDDSGLPGHLEQLSVNSKSSRKQKKHELQLKEDNDEIADFLDSKILSKMMHSTVGAKNKQKQKSTNINDKDVTFDKNGKLVVREYINDSDDAERGAPVQEDFYKQAIRGSGEDAFERLPSGKIKFLKGNKRLRDDYSDDDEDLMDDVTGKKHGSNNKMDTKTYKMLGKQYQAKKAKGDVKKSGMPDPFAYIPLNSKMGGTRNRPGSVSYKKLTKCVAKPEGRNGKGVKKSNKRHK